MICFALLTLNQVTQPYNPNVNQGWKKHKFYRKSFYVYRFLNFLKVFFQVLMYEHQKQNYDPEIHEQ